MLIREGMKVRFVRNDYTGRNYGLTSEMKRYLTEGTELLVYSVSGDSVELKPENTRGVTLTYDIRDLKIIHQSEGESFLSSLYDD